MNNSTNLILNRDAPPFNNPDCARLALAIDRKAFIDILNQGDAELGGTMQPTTDGVWGLPQTRSSNRCRATAPTSPRIARRPAMMKKLGYGPDKHLALKIATRGISLYKDPAVILAGQLKEIWIDADVDIIETAQLVHQGRAQALPGRAQHHRQRRRRSRPELLRELLLQVGAQLHRLLQSPRSRSW